jgi:hypothetical protein
MAWIDIVQYRDFWDVPRIFLILQRDQLLLFDCAFDEQLEDYPDSYTVYCMPNLTEEDLSGSWRPLPAKALSTLATVPIDDVVFDPTRRKAIQSNLIDRLLALKPPQKPDVVGSAR